MNLVANEIHFVIACLCCQKRRWNSDYIHVLLDELWKYSCLWSTHGQDSCTVTYKQLCLIRTLIIQKIYLLKFFFFFFWFLKVGGGMGQGSATDLTQDESPQLQNLGLNQPSVSGCIVGSVIHYKTFVSKSLSWLTVFISLKAHQHGFHEENTYELTVASYPGHVGGGKSRVQG